MKIKGFITSFIDKILNNLDNSRVEIAVDVVARSEEDCHDALATG